MFINRKKRNFRLLLISPEIIKTRTLVKYYYYIHKLDKNHVLMIS